MTKIRLRYIHTFKDRHGKTRYYYRHKGQRIALPGLPGSSEFMTAYQSAVDGVEAKAAAKSAPPPGSISALISAYYRTADFVSLRDSTKATYRGILERFRAKYGPLPVKRMTPKNVRNIISAKAETPAAANNLLRILRLLMRLAVEDGWREDDPTVGVRRVKHESEGFETWSEDDIAKFEACHPLGSTQRLAFALLLYTGARRGDVVKLGRQNVESGRLHYRQQKTGARVSIPIHAELAATLETVPAGQMVFLVTSYGKPFSPNGFYNWFAKACERAGLPKGRSPHGLRKAIARRLAEAGCTPHEIGAITGHATLKEIERYTAKANREGLADSAVAALRVKE